MKAENSPKPCIAVTAAMQITYQHILREVLAGIEEEGVPCRIQPSNSGSTVELAYYCAQESPLGVGIAVGQSGDVAVHYNRLLEEEPLFYLSSREGNQNAWRTMGSHGARLVKGIPFKAAYRAPSCFADPSSLEAQIRLIIKKILNTRDS